MSTIEYDKREKIELWRRAANKKCNFCYGRGHVTRVVKDKKYVTRCDCIPEKSLIQAVNDGDVTLKGRRNV